METVLYACSALAVVVVAFQVAFFADRERIVLIEAALLVFAIFMLWAVRRRGLHDRWVSARHLAEWARAVVLRGRDRLAAADRALGRPGRAGRGRACGWPGRAPRSPTSNRSGNSPSATPACVAPAPHGWLDRAPAALLRRRGDPCRQPRAPLPTRHRGAPRLQRRVRARDAFVVGGEHAGHVWVFGSITLPVIGASVHAIGSAATTGRTPIGTERWRKNSARSRPEVERAGTLRDVKAAAGRVEQVVTREAQEWFSDIRLKTPELPF